MSEDRDGDGGDDGRADGGDADRDDGHDDGLDTDRDDGRDVVDLPETIELPRLLDFYELQTADHTGIHEFYANLRDGDLSTTRCTDCGEVHFPPRIVCPACQSDALEYVDLPHEGELFAFSTVRAGAPMGMEDDVPFVTGIVDLGEVRLSTRIDGAEYEELSIGDPVSLNVVEIDGPADHERVFYRFEPTERSTAESTEGST